MIKVHKHKDLMYMYMILENNRGEGDFETKAKEAYYKNIHSSLNVEELQEIATSGYYSCLYALRTRQRFELGEEAISKKIWSSYNYALMIGRFVLCEKIIINNVLANKCYVNRILGYNHE